MTRDRHATTVAQSESPAAAWDAVQALRRRILRDHRPDSCVITCKATQRLLRAMGIDSQPLAVSVLVVNAVWQRRAEAGLPPLEDPAAWSVGIGKRYVTDRPVRVGHLILLTADQIVDPSLDQAARPKLPVEAAVAPLAPEQRATLLAGGSVSFENPETGVVVTYTGHPGDKGYTVSPNWGNRDARLVEQMVGDVIREMRSSKGN